MRKLRVLVLVHEDLVPPKDLSKLTDKEMMPFKTEFDVVGALGVLGHDVQVLGLRDELTPLREALVSFKPHIAFNMLEEFRGEAVYDHNVVAYLELQDLPYTGCSPRGLVIARDKALSKKILHYHRIRVPRFAVVQKGRKPRIPTNMAYPLIVKSLVEESSTGISNASVVYNLDKLQERVQFIHRRVHTDAIVEQFIDGRELYLAVMGNQRLTTFPVWELLVEKPPEGAPFIATQTLKWDVDYQKRHGVTSGRAKGLSEELELRIQKVAKRIYRRLDLDGYARIDFRLSTEGELYFLEANPNPDIAVDEEFADGAAAAGLEYEQMIQRILNLGLRRARG